MANVLHASHCRPLGTAKRRDETPRNEVNSHSACKRVYPTLRTRHNLSYQLGLSSRCIWVRFNMVPMHPGRADRHMNLRITVTRRCELRPRHRDEGPCLTKAGPGSENFWPALNVCATQLTRVARLTGRLTCGPTTMMPKSRPST